MTEKACKQCKTIFDKGECPNCGSKESTDSWKGRAIILNPEKSELAKNLKITKAGEYAIKA